MPARIAPIRGAFHGHPWEGALPVKPWDYRVCAAIPVIDPGEELTAVVELLRLQTVRPYIVIVDTGSTADNLDRLLALRDDDVEVHQIAAYGWRHPSEPVAVAMDLATAICRSPFLFCTHSDVFLRRREVLADLVELADRHGVAGYQISPRPHADWEWMVGHTCTMFAIDRLDEIRASWNIRRMVRNHGHRIGLTAGDDYGPSEARPNWPDTELGINYDLAICDRLPHLIGSEENYIRNRNRDFDHCRSLPSSRLYDARYQRRAESWLADALSSAWGRIHAWREVDGITNGEDE